MLNHPAMSILETVHGHQHVTGELLAVDDLPRVDRSNRDKPAPASANQVFPAGGEMHVRSFAFRSGLKVEARLPLGWVEEHDSSRCALHGQPISFRRERKVRR